ncbi:MAG: hypothetical protein LJE95_00635 [Acidobacteria bacterium]|nr:hypothetical protein [Acidobacteriota bacterium]
MLPQVKLNIVGKNDMEEHSRTVPLFLIVVAATVAVMIGCTCHRDRFWPDTQAGMFQFTDPVVVPGDEERLVSLEFIDAPDGPRAIRRLTHEFHVGDVVTVGVFVPIVGDYHEGGGWVFSGRKYHGKVGVAGDVKKVTSSDPEVVSATVNQTGRLELSALAPGTSTISVSAVMSRRYADRYRNGDKSVFEDQVLVEVRRIR